jgi:uncharacterized glyoxalase superfamily protein PhnB
VVLPDDDSLAAVGTTAAFESVVPHIAVPDVVRTAEHYRDRLGFEIAGFWDGAEVHHDASRPAVFGIVRRGPVAIHLNAGKPRHRPSQAAAGAYDLYFNVDDLSLLDAELRARGAEILEGPTIRPYGRREMVVRDCNGLILAFGEA